MMNLSKVQYKLDMKDTLTVGPKYLNINYDTMKSLLKEKEKTCIVNKNFSGFLDKIYKIDKSTRNTINKNGSLNIDVSYVGNFFIINNDDIVLAKVVKVYTGIIRGEIYNNSIKVIIETSNDYDNEKFELNKNDNLSYKKTGKEISLNDELIVKIKDVEIHNNNEYIYATGVILDILEEK